VSTAAATAPAPQAKDAISLVERAFRARELSLVAVLGLVVLLTASSNSRFVSSQSLRDILLNVSIIALLAVGQTVVVITRNIDLSVGSVLGISALATGVMFADHDTPIALAVLLAVGIGAGFGAINGALTALGRVPSLVVTLGTLYIIRGIDFAAAGGRQVNAADMPDGFLKIGTNNVLGLPLLALIAVGVMLVVGIYLRSYRSGRELYAIGSNPDAAQLAGIRVGRRVFAAFVLSGALAGLAGVLYAARYGTIDANAGRGYELAVVAAVVVGGVNIFGGVGSVYGAALGALLLSTITSALVILKVNPFWGEAVNGFLLLVAIALDAYLAARLAAALRKRSRNR
jgi:rhamnose transport system permease protein